MKIKHILSIFFLFVVLLCTTKETYATHIMGGEISYRYLGFQTTTGTFRYSIKLSMYVWAGAGSAYQPIGNPNNPNDTINWGAIAMANETVRPQIAIYRKSNNQRLDNRNIVMNKAETSPRTPPSCTLTCLNGVRIWYNWFEYTVDLPFDAAGYIAYHRTADRNNTINLGNGLDKGNTFQTVIPSPGEFPNSSPQFTDVAIPFMLTNINNTFINTATDPDGDRLQYSFGAPFDGQRLPPPNTYTVPAVIPMLAGFTPLQPFGTVNGSLSSINASSGLTSFFATVPGSYSVTLEISEYRAREGLTDTLIGVTRRELQIIVRETGTGPNDCPPNLPPNITPSTIPTVYNINSGQSVNFNFGYTDPEGDSLSIEPLADIISGTNGYTGPRATLERVTGDSSIQTSFNWNTNCQVLGTYVVRVTAGDKGCPPSTTRAVFTVNVSPFRGPRTITGQNRTCADNSIYNYSVSSLAANSSSIWKVQGGTLVGNPNNTTSIGVRWTTGSSTNFIRLVSTASSAAGGCKDSVSVPVVTELIPPLQATTNTNRTICQGERVQLNVTGGNGIYTWSPTTGLSDPNIANPVAIPTDTTTYIVSCLSANGCIQRDTVLINTVQNLRLPATVIACQGQEIGIGQAIVPPGYSIIWYETRNFVNSGNTVFNPRVRWDSIPPGGEFTYRYVVTGPFSCGFGINTVTFRVQGQPILGRAPNDSVCNGSSYTFGTTPQSGFSYVWRNTEGDVVTGPSVTRTYINTSTVYRRVTWFLTATNIALGCPGLDTVLIDVAPTPTMERTTLNVCSGVQSQFTNTPTLGYQYAWLSRIGLSDTSVANPDVTLLNFGTAPQRYNYQVRITDLNTGCANTVPVFITVNPLPAKTAGPDTASCSNVAVQIGTPAIANEIYIWEPLSTNNLLVTGGLVSISGAQVLVLAQNPTPNPITIGFKKTITNNITNCVNLDTVFVTIKPLPVAIAGTVDTISICPGQTAILGAPRIAGLRYLWSPTTGLTNPSLPQPLVAGINTGITPIFTRYILLVTDSTTNCEKRDTVTIRVEPNPRPIVGRRDTACSNELAQIGSAPVIGFGYKWVPATNLSSDTLANPIFQKENLSATEDTIRYTLIMTNKVTGCLDSARFAMRVRPQVVALAGSDLVVCPNEPARVGGETAIPLYRYTWSLLNGLSPGLTGGLNSTSSAQPAFTATNSTNAAIRQQLVVEKFNLRTTCSDKDTVDITINPPPPNTIEGDTAFACSGSAGIIGEPGDLVNYSYRWTPNTNISNDTVPTAIFVIQNATQQLVTTRYQLLKTNRLTGCTTLITVYAGIQPLPINDLAPTAQLCSEAVAILGSDSVDRYVYEWSPTTYLDNRTTARVTFTKRIPDDSTPTSDTIVRNVIDRITGCQKRDTVIVVTNPKPIADAGRDTAFCSGDSVTIGDPVGTADRIRRWTDLETGRVLSEGALVTISNINNTQIPDTTKLVFEVILGNGCTNYDTVNVITNPRPLQNPVQFPSLRVCPDVQGVSYSVPDNIGYTYNWQVRGGAIASGQGSAAITVNWGSALENAGISVVPTNQYGCVGTKDSVIISINERLKPDTAIGAKRLCTSEPLLQTYSTGFTANSTYTWYTNGLGTIEPGEVQGNPQIRIRWSGPGLGKIWIRENSNTSTSRCEGFSDTLMVNVYEAPKDTLTVFGDTGICATSEPRTYQMNGLAGSTYQWQISPAVGAVIIPSTTNQVQVRWEQAGNYQLTAVETTVNGCVGVPIGTDVSVNPVPATQLAATYDSLLCSTELQNRPYVISGLRGSRFFWRLEGGAFVGADPSGSLDTAITINWQATGPKKLSVFELTESGCSNDSLRLPIRYDNSELVVVNLTRDEDNDSLAIVTFNLANTTALPADRTIAIDRRSVDAVDNFTTQANLDRGTSEYTQQLSSSTETFEYTAKVNNQCGTELGGQVFRLLTLKGNAEENTQTTNLSWNGFVGWPNGVNKYEIYREVDDAGTLQYLTETSANTLSFSAQNGGDGFTQVYRIKALENGGNLFSWSNRIVVNFSNPLQPLGNTITPNGDGINERVLILNLKLYPNHRVRVFNRFGTEVYRNNKYENEFDGQGLPDGVYYLEIEAYGERPVKYYGLLTILRQ
jgi:gliding motility-associated-like protein